MRVVLFGATGMLGSGTLIECLHSPEVEAVLVVGRRSCGVEHEKLRELIMEDMFDYSSVRDQLIGHDACFFCLGISSARMSEDAYHRITYELPLKAAQALLGANPGMTFCHVSGTGAYSSEQGPMMWARVKGMIENKLIEMGFGSTWIFRPGFIQPVKGVRSRTPMYNVVYALVKPLYLVLSRLTRRSITTTEMLGRAMIRAARDGAPKTILHNSDINRLAE